MGYVTWLINVIIDVSVVPLRPLFVLSKTLKGKILDPCVIFINSTFSRILTIVFVYLYN